MTSPSLQKAQKVIRKNVPRAEIGQCYLLSEFPNLISDRDEPVASVIEGSLAKLTEKQMWRLLEALSYTYRMNGVFAYITARDVDWYELELPVSSVTLSGTLPHINDIVYSAKINRNPVRFASYLNEYFANHPDDDPQDLNQFRRSDADLRYPVLMTREWRGKILMLDGTHRLIGLARSGASTIRTYSAVRNHKRSKVMIGDSSFLTLERLFKRYTRPVDRDKIVDVAIMLAKMSTDGESAVQEYWINHPRTPAVKAAGAEILRRLK